MNIEIESKCLRSGQARPYQDSVYQYQVKSTKEATDAEVWEACQKLRRAENRRDGIGHTGACGFPFGLSSFGSLNKQADGTWIYAVTKPYCD